MDIRYCLVVWCCFMRGCNLQEPSGKIDFDDSTHTSSPNVQIVKTVTACSSTGCNSTQNTNNDNSSQVNTEILVHVQTKVNLKQDKNKSNGSDTGEVPVYLGCNGQQKCSSNTDHSYDRSRGPNYGDNYNGYRPSITDKQQPFIPSWLESGSYGNGHESHGYGPTNRENFTPQLFPLPQPRPVHPNNYYGNDEEIHIPYFTHSNNHHNFNTDPPFSIINNNKRHFHNPVEIRTGPANQWRPIFGINRNYKHDFNEGNRNFINPSNDPGQFRQFQPTQSNSYPNTFHRYENGLECVCRRLDTDLDTASSNVASRTAIHNNPGRRIKINSKSGGFIDDKLGPLN